MEEGKRVAILWREPWETDSIHAGTQRGGVVRCYPRDQIDGRWGQPTYTTTIEETLAGLAKGDRTRFAVPVDVARHFAPDWPFEDDCGL